MAAKGYKLGPVSIEKLRRVLRRKYSAGAGISIRTDGDVVSIGLAGRQEPLRGGDSVYVPGTIAGSSVAEGAPEDVTYTVTLRDGTPIGPEDGGLVPISRVIHAPSTTWVVAAPVDSDCVLELGGFNEGPPPYREVQIVVCKEYLKTRPCVDPVPRPFVGLDCSTILTDKAGLPITDKHGALMLAKQATSVDVAAAMSLLTDKYGLPITDRFGAVILDKSAASTAEGAWRTLLTDKHGQVMSDRFGTLLADKTYTGD